MEILAPATASSYKQVIYSGADAIYFGYGDFNARVNADNFNSSLDEVVAFCHLYNVKAYLTLNIAMKDSELDDVERIIIEAEKANIDAFIISDMSLLAIIKRLKVKAQVHASTQLGIHNSDGAELVYQFGFDRVVLSREVNLRELRNVGSFAPLDLEFFIHGALCVGFSGACLFSSMLNGCSGNRGRCKQLCRLYYDGFVDGKKVTEGYLLSAKDICMANRLGDIGASGVRSLKIEGRLRRSEYAAGVTEFYSAQKYDTESDITIDELKCLFNRGDYTEGYFNGNDVIYPDISSSIGLNLGKIVRLINPHTGLLSCRRAPDRTDGLKLIRDGKEVSGCSATGTKKDGCVIIYCSKPIRIGDCVHITNCSSLNKQLNEKRKPLPVSIHIELNGGETPRIQMYHYYYTATYQPDMIIEKSITQPVTPEEIIAQFRKMGDSDFRLEKADVMTKDAFITKAQLNTLRRDALAFFRDYIISNYKRKTTSCTDVRLPERRKERETGDYIEVPCAEFLTEITARYVKKAVYSPDVYTVEGCERFCQKAKNLGLETYIRPPIFVADSETSAYDKLIKLFDGILCNNVGLILRSLVHHKKSVAGPNLNIFNTENPLIDLCDDYFISPELNGNEIRPFERGILYMYGHLPLMYLSCCPRKVMGLNCQNCDGKKIEIGDRLGERYTVRTVRLKKGECKHLLKNCALTDVGNRIKGRNYYFDFTESTPEEAEEVLLNYYESGDYEPRGTNKLHLSRGVL